MMLADGNGAFVQALGLEMDGDALRHGPARQALRAVRGGWRGASSCTSRRPASSRCRARRRCWKRWRAESAGCACPSLPLRSRDEAVIAPRLGSIRPTVASVRATVPRVTAGAVSTSVVPVSVLSSSSPSASTLTTPTSVSSAGRRIRVTPCVLRPTARLPPRACAPACPGWRSASARARRRAAPRRPARRCVRSTGSRSRPACRGPCADNRPAAVRLP